MAKKCYWVDTYFTIDGKKIEYNLPYFAYGVDKSKIIDFETFDELYIFVKNLSDPCCYVGKTVFRKRLVYLSYLFEGSEHITEKNFDKYKIQYVKKYREYKPTVKEAIEFLTVDQFKEYSGFTKGEISQ